MKKRAELKNLLGLTQDEMALVLGITKSQWSMYKSGKRDLPLAAVQQLAALLQGVQNKQIAKETKHFIKEESEKTNKKIKEHYEKAQIKLHRLKKEITSLEKQRAECFVALQTTAFLEQQNETSELAASIKTRAIKSLQKHSLFKIEQLQMQKENFETIKNKLEQKIKVVE